MDISGRFFSVRRRSSFLRSGTHLSQSLQRFMASALVTWVKTLGSSLELGDSEETCAPEPGSSHHRDGHSDYLKLVDGVFLNRVMRQIDPNPQTQRIYHNERNDEVLRVQNLSILMQHIRTFYQEDLQQLILMSPPNVQLLGRDPLSDEGMQELDKVLLLLLGCAVQSERKEDIIKQIQTLDLDTQISVAAHIREVTQNPQNVVALHWPDLSSVHTSQLELLFENMACHLKNLARQRDDNLERIMELTQERERLLGEAEPSTRGTGETHQSLSVQLADSKSKLRRLQHELEEQSERLQDCKQEVQDLRSDCKHLQKQNRELVLEARTAQTYRDEADVLREKAAHMDRLQREVKAYKERLNSIEFYKAKAEEEREYSRALLETKTLLEKELEAARTRCDKFHELEVENLLLRSALEDLEMERETDRQRMDELLDVNLSLKVELNDRVGESSQALWRLGPLSEELSHQDDTVKPLSCEVGEATSGQLLLLERENQELRLKLAELQQSSMATELCSSAKIASLEQDRQQLHATVQQVEQDLSLLRRRIHHLEPKGQEVEEGTDRLPPGTPAEGKVRQSGPEALEEDGRPAQPNQEAEECRLPRGTEEETESLEEACCRLRLECQSQAEALEKALARASKSEEDRRIEEEACRRLRLECQSQAEALEKAQARASEVEEAGRRWRREVDERREAAEREKESAVEALRWADGDRRQLEKENRRLRHRAEAGERSLNAERERLAVLDGENRRLRMEVARVGELEGERGELARRLTSEQKALAALREDLTCEQVKSGQLVGHLEKLSRWLQRLAPTTETPSQEEPPHQPSYELLEIRLDATFKEAIQMKEAHIDSLRRELGRVEVENHALSEQLVQLKETLELPQPEDDVINKMADAGSEGEETKRDHGRLVQDTFSERLIEVERKNATLLAEKAALSGCSHQLELQTEGLQVQVAMLQKHCIALQEQVSGLQTLNTRLQVENTGLSMKNEGLAAEVRQQQARQASLEAEAASLGQERSQVVSQLEVLMRDHAQLAILHERQGAELEALVQKHRALKSHSKDLEAEHRELEGRYNQLQAEEVRLKELEAALKTMRDRLEEETRKERNLYQAHQQLKEDYNRLSQIHGEGQRQWEELQGEQQALKGQLQALQQEKARTEVEHGVLKEQYQQLDVRWTTLSSHCELLGQLKGNLEEENRHLMQQLQALTHDNRALLEKSAESRDLYHEEQRQYTDKLNKLRREKQKLLEKIMDQYRVVEPVAPRSRKGNWIADKMKKLIKPRKEMGKDQLRPHFINPTSSLEIPEGIVHLSQLENGPEMDQPSGSSDAPGPPRKSSEGTEQQGKVAERVRRKLSSRVYGTDTPRHRFRQRRVGWEEAADTRNTGSRDSDPTLDGKEMTKNLETNHNKVREGPRDLPTTEGVSHTESREGETPVSSLYQ
ncbi:girdin-like isoform X3 [Narcine bancroftii]|uniref:girdin-like isoform X3 n=1 Tax=Narcine bancroftii TaxID=1343680 RepID=UPI0038319AE7